MESTSKSSLFCTIFNVFSACFIFYTYFDVHVCYFEEGGVVLLLIVLFVILTLLCVILILMCTAKSGGDFTRITFRPDFQRFQMTGLDADIVALMSRRVIDIAGVSDKSLKV